LKEPGPLLASGREADIFEYGPGLVLRRSREGRPVEAEARIMAHLHDLGYPVPAVDEVSDDGLAMVLERIDGLTMVETLSKQPWTIRRHGRMLADLHRQLHELDAPDWLKTAPVGTGDKIVHLDLHPLNVMLSKKGPVVIDWANASRGNPGVDVATAWVLMAAADVPTSRLMGLILGRGRQALVDSFLSGVDRGAAAEAMPETVAWKVGDAHMSAAEQQRMWQLARQLTS
jgi:aminoglycoside phosphotransferase (APT) family kinase protein